MYHSFWIHSFADGHLGCFQYLAIVNCAAMNKNITRDFEVKNNLTIARGRVGRGQWGEGITGTTIKDTWTNSRGRVKGWGEKAYNCN